jgi:hypothetical protein
MHLFEHAAHVDAPELVCNPHADALPFLHHQRSGPGEGAPVEREEVEVPVL